MEQEEFISYKIDTKHTYRVYVNESNGKKFYKVQVQKKNNDGTKVNFYKQLKFVKCVPPENEDIIRIKKGFEDLYINNIDKYNAISVIVVMDYEMVDNPKVNQNKAYSKFQNNLYENEFDEELDIDENFLD